MATRSTIALEFADGTVGMIYCHWDGYLDNNGAILREHYMDPFKVRELIDLGDLSSLRPQLGTRHPFSSIGTMDSAEYDKLYGDMCTFYGRDRGETNVNARYFKNFEEYAREHQREEYEYILRNVNGNAQWFVEMYGCDGEYLTLEDAFEFQAAREKEEV
jgi:hypothetical protein